ncbi:hypothetical protein E4U37_006333, partial [Claviceps purpurea]
MPALKVKSQGASPTDATDRCVAGRSGVSATLENATTAAPDCPTHEPSRGSDLVALTGICRSLGAAGSMEIRLKDFGNCLNALPDLELE